MDKPYNKKLVKKENTLKVNTTFEELMKIAT
jgi:hypothetical protein